MHKRLLAALLAAPILTLAHAAQLPKPPASDPPGELGRMVALGRDIIMHTGTNPLTRDLVGNKLTCASCHIDGGTTSTVGSFIGTATVFPAFSAREGTVQTLQDRSDNCFMRSMNGKRPIVDSEASLAMVAYISWLSDGQPLHMSPVKPVNPAFAAGWPDRQLVALVKQATHANYVNGGQLYQSRCASCHGADGLGNSAFPPVWGPDSFNAGAGLSKAPQMASWMAQNMPLGNANLTPQEVADITVYIDAQPRPDFDLKAHLLPRDQMGVYNSRVQDQHASPRSDLKAVGLDIDVIRGDHTAH